MIDTYFAPARRKSAAEIQAEMNLVSDNPVLNLILEAVGGFFVILDDARQIVAVNESFLKVLDIVDVGAVVGHRLGEVIDCENSHAYPNGCGTTKKCKTCGAVISTMYCLSQQKASNNFCTVKRDTIDEGSKDMVFRIKASPFAISGNTYVLMFLQDVTKEHELSALERTFFHDIRNTLSGVSCAADLLSRGIRAENMTSTIKHSCVRLEKEIDMQACLSSEYNAVYRLSPEDNTVGGVLEELNEVITCHTALKGKYFEIKSDCRDLGCSMDVSLVLRVLLNMVINALEASEEGGEVLLSATNSAEKIVFSVKNGGVIPESVAERIFQRNFTTKGCRGRGLGTFSMKLFGEDILKGKVCFISSEDEGTVFSFEVPYNKPRSEC